MKELIVVSLKPTELKQQVYIMTEESEIIPIVIECPTDELPSVIAMSAAKYKLDLIKLMGPKSYAKGIKDILTEKINTCFGKDNKITIEL